jgi:predicted DNA binding CopG/RHH family protein
MKRRKSKAERKETRITVRLDKEQAALVEQKAKKKGLGIAPYVRMIVIQEAEKAE